MAKEHSEIKTNNSTDFKRVYQICVVVSKNLPKNGINFLSYNDILLHFYLFCLVNI